MTDKLVAMPAAGTTVKSDQRRQGVVDAAVSCFARKGFYGATTHEIAERAGISQPYLYRLFANKQTIFVAAVEHVGEVLTEALSTADTTEQALQTAYGTIIEDGDIMRFLMQANCAADEPLIRDAVRACYARQVAVVHKLLDGDEEAVRRWFGAGMLANVTTMLGLTDLDAPWARTLAGT